MTFIFIAIGILAIFMIYLFTVTDRLMDVVNGLQNMVHAQSEVMKNNLDLTAEVMNNAMNELEQLRKEFNEYKIVQEAKEKEAAKKTTTKKRTTKKDSE